MTVEAAINKLTAAEVSGGGDGETTAVTAESRARQRPVVQSRRSSRPFSAFERMVAWRYLRSRRKEAFISVIAGFSFIGIMLGVATLIIVMAVMNGFRTELISRILGINGHMIVAADRRAARQLCRPRRRNFPASRASPWRSRWSRARRWHRAAAAPAPARWCAASAPTISQSSKSISDNIKSGDLVGFAAGTGRCDRLAHGRAARHHRRRHDHADLAGRRRDADGRQSARQILYGLGDLRDRHVGI